MTSSPKAKELTESGRMIRKDDSERTAISKLSKSQFWRGIFYVFAYIVLLVAMSLTMKQVYRSGFPYPRFATGKYKKQNIIKRKYTNDTYHTKPAHALQIILINAPESQTVSLGVVFLVSFLCVLVLFCPTLFEHSHQNFQISESMAGVYFLPLLYL